MRLIIATTLLIQLHKYTSTTAFTSVSKPITFISQPSSSSTPSLLSQQNGLTSSTSIRPYTTTTPLFAKKKAKKLASNIDLSAFDDEDDEPLSKKDAMMAAKKEKKQKNKATAAAAAAEALDAIDPSLLDDDEPLSRKDAMMAEKKANKGKKAAAAALAALEQLEKDEAKQAAAAASSGGGGGDNKILSKKELKALKKKQDKEAEKAAKREAKKQQKQEAAAADSDSDTDAINGATPPDPTTPPPPPTTTAKPTLEDRIRKERPPPRVRIIPTNQPNYSSLRLEDVYITFRNQDVLRGVTWGVQTGDRVGLVGPNGGGKTTQIKILAGEMEPTSGDVLKSKEDLRVAVLRQEFVEELVLERSLKEEMRSVFVEEEGILNELKMAERELELVDASDGDRMQEILDRMQEIQGKADDKDVYALDSRVMKVMDLMGFTEEEGGDPVASFSGGWKMRIGLGKVLLKEPNILLLDEPTNHLDLESVEWLEEFLKNQNIPMVIVSHDREFLDRVCTKIVDTEGGVATEYDGNYSRFLQLKKARMDSWNAAYNAQEKKIKEEKSWINKFKLKQPQATKQRQAKLDKMINSPDYVQKPPFVGKPFKFRFPDAPRLSPEVATIKNLSHSYADGANRLFEDVELDIEKNDRIAVLGPNGSGKSTLLRLMMGREDPSISGSAEIIGQNVIANYFEQNQADALDLDLTVIQTVEQASTQQSYNELRALLGQFLFKGDSVEKKVRNLSGGEKARLSLCCMMLRPANLLVLDEPTNHLDIPAKEMLEEALQHFQGSVMVVSHDRFFISRIATTIVAIEEKKLVKYAGDYKFYMERSKDVKDKVEARYVAGVDRIGAAPRIDLDALAAGGGKKNFGGAKNANMVTRKDKGVKNAKRKKEQII